MLAIQPTQIQLPAAPAAPKRDVEPIEPCEGEDCFGRSLRDADRAVQRDEASAIETSDDAETQEVQESAETEAADDADMQDESQDVIDETVVVADVPAQPAAREVAAAASGVVAQPIENEQSLDDELLIDDEGDEPDLKVTEVKTESKVTPAVGSAREGDVAVNRHGPHVPQPGSTGVQGIESASAQGLADRPVVVTTTPLEAAQFQSAVDQLERTGEVDPNVARVARGLQSALAQRGGAVTLRLQPPELGVVRIAVDIRDGVVRATFQAESESVRSMLTHQIGRLRHALEGQGLAIERLEVQPQTSQSALQQQMARDNDAEAEARSRGRREGGQPDQRRDGQPEEDSRFEQTLRDRVVIG